jgi:hypothetical protein
MIYHVDQAEGPVLDWMVAKAEGWIDDCNSWLHEATVCEVAEGSYHPSTDWSQGGPITDRLLGFLEKTWIEARAAQRCEAHLSNYEGHWVAFGPTRLIAAMRCFVASKLGLEIDVPLGAFVV